MIINPYNLKFTEISKTKEQNKDKNISISSVIQQLVKQLLVSNAKDIENINKEALEIKIKKELEINYTFTNDEKNTIISEVLNSLFGYGILQEYIDNPKVSDIRVVAFNNIYIKVQGKWVKVNKQFNNQEEFDTYIRFCAMKNNSMINTQTPISVFSDRKNALRIEAGISPTNILNSSLVIRVHQKEQNITMEELLLKYDMMNATEYLLLKEKIINMRSIVICGKGGSGKTTLLKALLNILPNNVSITTIEETAEIFLKDRNVIQRECLLKREGDNKIDLEKLAQHSLVMSNDVIVLGELKRSRS